MTAINYLVILFLPASVFFYKASRRGTLPKLGRSMLRRFGEGQQAKSMQAHIERRNRLMAQIRADNPSYTETEIEARLEVFGA